MIDFGETYSSDNFEVRDVNGDLADAGTVTATITLPDGTTTNPAVNHPSTGLYNFDYLTTQAGRHVVVVSATGGILGSLVRNWTDAFDVSEADPGYIVSLADTKKHLNKTDTGDDEELRGLIASVTRVVEDHPEFGVGSVVRRTITERHHLSTDTKIRLYRPPILDLTSITAVLDGGTDYTPAEVAFDSRTGIVRRLDGLVFTGGPWDVTYTAGRTGVQANWRAAALEIIRHVWTTQRGGTPTGFRPGGAVSGEETWLPGFGFSVPRRALEMLEPDQHGPLVA
jgi:hypothetical protein